MDNQPYWYQLISHWVNVKKRTGLTIPFIIGAKNFFESNSNLNSVTELLNEIVESEIEETIILNNCPHVGEYVLGICSVSSFLSGTDFKNEETGNVTLIATTSTKILGEDFRSICRSLEKKYKNQINEGHFSKEDFDWTPFTENDIKMIEEAKLNDK